MQEIWKDIPEYEGFYQASNLGNIRRVLRSKRFGLRFSIKAQNEDKGGYLRVHLSKDGKAKRRQVHRLVCAAFIPNPDNNPQVNHKDGDKHNNTIENLEWCTESENMLHRYRVLGHTGTPIHCQNVKCVETGKIYDSIREASRATGISRTLISRCSRGHTVVDGNGHSHTNRTAGGYHWKYVAPE